MFKLIHADFYKTFHRSAFYLMLLIFCGLALVMAVAMRGGQAGTWSGSLSVGIVLLSYPPMLLPLITQLVLGEEYQEHTMKNTLSFGTDRGLAFFSKWISSVLLGLILMAAVFGVFFGGAALLLEHDTLFSQELVKQFLRRLGASSLIYIAAVTASLFFYAVFNRNALAIFLYYGAFYLSELLLMLFHLGNASTYLLKTQLDHVTQGAASMQQPILVSLVTMAAFFAAGLAVSCRKDLA